MRELHLPSLPSRMHLPALLTLPVAALLACGTPPAAPPEYPARAAASAAPADPASTATADGPHACPRSTALSAEGVQEELTCLLQQYVRIDTTNPPGNELAAARFLSAVLQRDGIASQVIESAPGRANLIARLPGKTPGQALVLMHHMDVVPAVAARWQAPPFAGEVHDGMLWGRGSLDNKGSGIGELLAVLMLKRLGITPPRDIILLAVADEEAGGGHGARFLMQSHRALFDDVAYVLGEGGAILDFGGGARLYSVERAQKAPLWLRLTASGKAGHGSSPRPDAASHTLVRALARLEAHRFPVRVLPEVQALFQARAQGMPEAARAPLMDLRGALRDKTFAAQFLADPHQAALVQNTLSITMLSGSDKENVLPGEASAVLDLRLLPGEDAAAVTEEVRRVMAEPGIRVDTLLSWKAHTSPADTPLFAAIAELAAERDPGAAVAANVIGGFTDCNAFRAAGIHCYGFMPMRLSPTSFPLIHGDDERASLSALSRSVVDLAALVQIPR